jgi:DNA-binding transcriptional LysR family regulator
LAEGVRPVTLSGLDPRKGCAALWRERKEFRAPVARVLVDEVRAFFRLVR